MKILLAMIAALTTASCATSQPRLEPTLYERLGGGAAITAIVDGAIVDVAADPRINQRFANLGPGLARNLGDLICLRTGGPCKYIGADMSAAHEGMFIRDEEFDALVEDMAKSLDKSKAPPREKDEVLVIFRQMRNAIVRH